MLQKITSIFDSLKSQEKGDQISVAQLLESNGQAIANHKEAVSALIGLLQGN